MASLQQKRPSISNWFSSLRRQPKNKKSVANTNNSFYGGAQKQYQRSCIDLSNAVHHNNSSFYVPNQNQQYSPYQDINSSVSRIGSTDTILQDDDRRGLMNGKSVAQLCSRCCCAISRPATPSPKLSPKYLPKSPARSPSLTPLNTVATYIHLKPSTPPPASPSSPLPVTLSSETVITTDVSNDMTVTQSPPCASESENVNTVNKRAEFKRQMTTTTTRTLVVSRPLELVLNEQGEIISRRPAHLETIKTRSNSLDCVLDSGVISDDECNISSSNSYSPCSPTPTASPTSALISGESGEFRFIDDSSTSQSETDRNSQQSAAQQQFGRRLNENEPQMLRTTRRSYTNPQNNASSNNNYHTNNNNFSDDRSKIVVNLCDACKKVLEMNRTNAAQSAGLIIPKKQIKDELSEVLSEMEALDVPEDCKHSNKEKQMSIGRKKFNMDPKKGIEYLVENRLLRHDAQDVAHFLYKGEGLNKTAIGDYLGEKNDFNEDVLKCFVALHDFTDLILVQALRQFLWSFRLPGEAQKIDRMMECFAQRYCQLNPDIFTNTDTCYVLSFAIIMLNTSLHNPSVKDKPTVEQFISMNRGINNGGDLPRELLESLYESIRTEPFKIPQDDGNDLMHTFFNPDKEGWLWKQGGRYKSWKRRWFILNDNCLYYFEYTTDKEPRGIIPLENISVREIHDRSKPHCFELFATGGADIIKACKTDSEGKVVEGKHTVYRMSASTEEDQQEWIKRLTQSISHNPFYDILVQRKKKALSKS